MNKSESAPARRGTVVFLIDWAAGLHAIMRADLFFSSLEVPFGHQGNKRDQLNVKQLSSLSSISKSVASPMEWQFWQIRLLNNALAQKKARNTLIISLKIAII